MSDKPFSQVLFYHKCVACGKLVEHSHAGPPRIVSEIVRPPAEILMALVLIGAYQVSYGYCQRCYDIVYHGEKTSMSGEDCIGFMTYGSSPGSVPAGPSPM
jgi:hypothetical protein